MYRNYLTIFFVIVLTSISLYSEENSVKSNEMGDNWCFYVLENDKTIKIDKGIITWTVDGKSIPCSGYSHARVFVSLIKGIEIGEHYTYNNDSYVEINVMSDIDGNAFVYDKKILRTDVTTVLSGFIDTPVVGKKMRISVVGGKLNIQEAKLTVSLYLIK